MIKTARSQKGVLMLEVLVALLIFSIGAVGMVMMQSISSANSVNSEDRATAALLANDMISELWAAFNPSTPLPPSLPADYTNWSTTRVPAALGTGALGNLGIAGNTVTVKITWTPKSANYTGNVITPPQSLYQTQVVIQ